MAQELTTRQLNKFKIARHLYLNQGQSIEKALGEAGISKATYYRFRKIYKNNHKQNSSQNSSQKFSHNSSQNSSQKQVHIDSKTEVELLSDSGRRINGNHKSVEKNHNIKKNSKTQGGSIENLTKKKIDEQLERFFNTYA